MTDTAVPGEVSPGGITHIKKELDGFQECSPTNSDMYSPTTTVMNDSGVSTLVDHFKASLIHFYGYSDDMVLEIIFRFFKFIIERV